MDKQQPPPYSPPAPGFQVPPPAQGYPPPPTQAYQPPPPLAEHHTGIPTRQIIKMLH